VCDPELLVYLPEPGKANGVGIIALPGGGMRILGVGKEADDMISYLNKEGYAVFILKYRIMQLPPPPPQPAGSQTAPPGGAMRFPKLVIHNANANPSPGDAVETQVIEFAIADTLKALALVRSNAAKWHIDPKRVGLIGSSAGGGVAIGTVLEATPDTMPAFLATLYGPSLKDVTVPKDAPPLFIATETWHGPVTDGLLALFSLWKDAGKPVEMHDFDITVFRMDASLWLPRFSDWMRERGLVGGAK
jgi:dienelactone hydrolase